MTQVILLAMIIGSISGNPHFPVDTFQTKDGKSLEITFIKHASLILNYDGRIVYVDPVSEYADYSSFPKADLILITHEHADHFDPDAIAAIKKPDTKIVSNLSVREKLGEGIGMKNGDRLQPEPWVTLQAVPAYNNTPGREAYHPKGRDNGYVVTLGEMRIYVAGDTEDIPEMQFLKNIDIAFLPVNQPYTMTVPQAVHAAGMVKPRILYPYHYGNTDMQKLSEALGNQPGIEVRIRPM